MIRLLALLLVAAGAVLASPAAMAATYTVTANRDTWIDQSNTGTNNGGLTTLRATTNGTGGAQTRPLIGFTLPAIPTNEVITGVVLQLRVTTAGTSSVIVHRTTAAWTENGATWSNINTNFNAAAEFSFTPSTVNSFVTADVTSLVQGWYAGTLTNHGVMLRGANSSLARFASRETGTAANRPQLIITTARIPPSFMMVKSSAIISDPYNLATNPKAIPGASIRYTISLSNSSAGTADSNTTVVTEAVPAGMKLRVADYGVVGSGPVAFTNGATSSGLTYTFTNLGNALDSIAFSNDNGTTYTYTPVADTDGCDAAVTHFRVSPTGAFAGKTGATDPSFTLQLRMQVE